MSVELSFQFGWRRVVGTFVNEELWLTNCKWLGGFNANLGPNFNGGTHLCFHSDFHSGFERYFLRLHKSYIKDHLPLKNFPFLKLIKIGVFLIAINKTDVASEIFYYRSQQIHVFISTCSLIMSPHSLFSFLGEIFFIPNRFFARLSRCTLLVVKLFCVQLTRTNIWAFAFGLLSQFAQS